MKDALSILTFELPKLLPVFTPHYIYICIDIKLRNEDIAFAVKLPFI